MSVVQDTEEWRPVVGYEGFYEVSNLGRVRSMERTARVVARGTESVRRVRSRIMAARNDGRGYVRICLARKRTKTYFPLSWLVLEAFVGPRPPGMQCCHFPDRNPQNNRLDNLRWGTAKENAADRDQHGTTCCGERSNFAKLKSRDVLEIRQLLEQGVPRLSLARRFGVAKQLIAMIARRKIWRHL